MNLDRKNAEIHHPSPGNKIPWGTGKTLLLTLLAFAVHYGIDKLYFGDLWKWLFQGLGHPGLSFNLAYAILGIPLFLAVLARHGTARFFHALGLDGSLGKGFAFALLCTLPMFLGFALAFEVNTGFTVRQFWINILAAAFFEELYFRGFLFGQLFRFTKLGFLSSVLLGALLFGLGHLYQGNGPMESLGIFGITFMGALLFAWVYVEWDHNLWVPIFLHLLMNLAWSSFGVAENALGGGYANTFRVLTILLVIGLTIALKRKKGQSMAIDRAQWL